MATVEKQLSAGDNAYRVWIIHTQQCARCRNNIHCSLARRMGRVWRALR